MEMVLESMCDFSRWGIFVMECRMDNLRDMRRFINIILVFLILIFHFLHDLIFLTVISVLVLCLFWLFWLFNFYLSRGNWWHHCRLLVKWEFL